MFPDEYTARLVRKEQTKDWLREVEKDQLIRLALSGQKRQAHFYCRLLASPSRFPVPWRAARSLKVAEQCKHNSGSARLRIVRRKGEWTSSMKAPRTG